MLGAGGRDFSGCVVRDKGGPENRRRSPRSRGPRRPRRCDGVERPARSSVRHDPGAGGSRGVEMAARRRRTGRGSTHHRAPARRGQSDSPQNPETSRGKATCVPGAPRGCPNRRAACSTWAVARLLDLGTARNHSASRGSSGCLRRRPRPADETLARAIASIRLTHQRRRRPPWDSATQPFCSSSACSAQRI